MLEVTILFENNNFLSPILSIIPIALPLSRPKHVQSCTVYSLLFREQVITDHLTSFLKKISASNHPFMSKPARFNILNSRPSQKVQAKAVASTTTSSYGGC